MYLAIGIILIAVSVTYFTYIKRNPDKVAYAGKGMGILMIVGVGLIIKQFYLMK